MLPMYDSLQADSSTRMFGSHPMYLKIIFRLVSFLHRIWSIGDSALGREQYHSLALYSLEESGSVGLPLGWQWCRFFKASLLLQSIGISIDCSPLFKYSFDAPVYLLPSKQGLSKVIGEDIKYLWAIYLGPQSQRWLFVLRISCKWVMALLLDPCIALGFFG
jgi:hypothetical protein